MNLLFVDLRGLQANEVVLANPRFATSVASCAAAITGESLTDIVGEDVPSTNKTAGTCDGPAIFSLLIASLISPYALLRFERSALGLRRLACWSRIAVAKSLSRAVAVHCAMGCYRQLWVKREPARDDLFP